MLLMVMFGSSLFSQTASLPTGTASPGEQISVPLSVTGFTKIGSIMFKIQIDPTILTYAGLTGEPAGMVGGVSGTTLTLTWNASPPVDFPDGVLLHIDFDYTGPGTSTMNFLPTSEIIRNNPPGNYTVLTVGYTNGLVTPYLLNTTKATILGQTCVSTGAAVSFPIKYEGFGSNVGSITQKIQYDATKLTFTGFSGTGTLSSALAGASGGIVTIAWENLLGANINYPANQIILNFTYTGAAGSTLSFYPGCIITTNGVVNIPVSYFDGTAVMNPIPTPVITPSGPTTFCTGGSVVLTAPAGYTYLWSTAATTRSITVTTSGTFTVTVSDGTCSAVSAPTTVAVVAQPSATITPGGPITLCTGGSVVLTAPAGAGYTYLWSTAATTQSITASTAGTYTVTVSNGYCSVTSAPTTVTIVAPPTATITAGGPTTFCAGGSVVLTANAGAGLSYLWSNAATTQSITVTTGGSYSVVVSNAGCSATSTPTVVTVNALPTATITPSGPTTFCTGGSVVLTASAATNYLWSTGATTQTITVTTSGNFTVTLSNGTCSNTSTVTTVLVKTIPVATITASGPTTFCAGGSVVLTAPAGTGVTYLWSTAATTQSITVTTSGTFTVTVSNGTCASTSTPTTVTVNALPVVTITAGGPTTFCAGGSVVLTASAGTSYLWSTSATTQSITVSTGGNYTVTVSNGTCSGTSTPTTVTVTTVTATITASGPTTFCTGNAVVLTASLGTSYLWSTAATTRSITVTTSGSYTVTVFNGTCSATSTPTVVTVNPLPGVTATNNGPLCATATLNLTGGPAGMTTYAWTGPNGFTSAVQSPSIANVTVAAAGTYTLIVTNSSGCTGTATTTVVVNAKPIATAINNGPLCAGATLNLTGGPAGMTTYAWTGPNGFISAVQSPSITNVTAAAAGVYSLIVTNSSGCTSVAATTTVVINALPVAIATNNGPVCVGATLNLTGGPAGMTTYAWSGPNGFISALQSPSIANVTAAAAGVYSLIVTNSSGCTSVAASTTVVVNALPVATASNNGPMCEGLTLNLIGGPAGMTSYAWTGPNGFTSNVQNPTINNVTAAAAGVYSLVVTNAGGCTSVAATTTVIIYAVPVASAANNGPMCEGGTLNLYGLPAGATSYLWTGPNGFTSAVQNPVIANVTAAATGDYVLVVSNAYGCQDYAVTSVTIYAKPATTASNNGPLCVGTTLNLVGGPAGMASYAWTGPNGFTSAVQNPTIANVTAANAGVYTLLTVNANGCSASANTTVVVNVIPETPVVTQNGMVLTSSAPAGNQWYYNGTLIPGATGQTYTVTHNTGWYWVMVTLNGCSSPISNKVWVEVVGVPEMPASASFTIYPVPSNGAFTAAINYPVDDIFTITIYNQLGEQIYILRDVATTGGKLDTQIDLRPIANGMYTVVFTNSSYKVVKRVIVNNK